MKMSLVSNASSRFMQSGKNKNVKCLTLNESWLYEFEALFFIFTRHGSYIPMSLNHHLCILSLILLVFKNEIYIYIYLRRKSTYIPKGDPIIYS
jgi:hypothetical protein